MDSFLLRTLNGSQGEGGKGKATHFNKLQKWIKDSPLYIRTAKTTRFYLRWAASISWVLGTTVLVLVFPLWLEVGREFELGQLEQEIMVGYQARGYPPQQLQAMQAQGQFGIPPMPPPQQPGFP